MMQRPVFRAAARLGQAGLSLIELMVSLVIGMVLSLALFAVLSSSEGSKRITGGLNDLDQAGNIVQYQLDQWVRSAGSGFLAAADYAYGCRLTATAASGQTLPRSAALPAPFASVNPDGSRRFALAPVIILPNATTPGSSGATSDVLVVMGGSAGFGGAPSVMTAAPGTTALTLNNTLSYAAGDMLLVADPNGTGGAAVPCMVTQVDSTFTGGTATSLTLGGSFHGGTINSTSLTGYSADAMALPLGNPTTNPPQFLVIGVGDNDTLFTYDLLQTAGADQALQARTQGVFEMHAIYGVDTDNDGEIDSWVSPSTGNYAPANLTAGSATANARLQQIKAVRVAMIMRLPLLEKTAVSPSSLTLFPDLAGAGLSQTRTLSTTEQRYRYRVVDTTLVLRNNLML
ncbi:PilW family protein [Ideonella margarita]|uniref:PilW family protein n=1 Tax=Ideonella margarita TaxID=2984191 RepID=A0ABU9C0Q9_9BURK